MSNPQYWPSMTDYQEALQSPSLAFGSSELSSGFPVENNLGLPRPICGTFASVYELVSGQRRWAVKCFLRNTPDLHERYVKISDHVRKCRRLGYFVAFEYQEKAIRVRGELFPLVKMEWIEASQLNTFVEENLSNPRVLAQLRKHWDRLVSDLRSAKIAHGDLQHGNVLVRSNGEIRLIDYDGMWVPKLEGQGSNETGHPDFQNPRRTQRDFHANIDEFSAAIIHIAIAALRQDKSLWNKYNNGDNLLFRRADFLDTQNSPLIADLRALNDRQIRDKLEFIVDACTKRKPRAKKRSRQGKTLNGKQQVKPANATTPMSEKKDVSASNPGSWLSDHVEDFGTATSAPSPQRPIGKKSLIGRLFRP
jgi:serine/threonine protein kinase